MRARDHPVVRKPIADGCLEMWDHVRRLAQRAKLLPAHDVRPHFCPAPRLLNSPC